MVGVIPGRTVRTDSLYKCIHSTNLILLRTLTVTAEALLEPLFTGWESPSVNRTDEIKISLPQRCGLADVLMVNDSSDQSLLQGWLQGYVIGGVV